MPCPCDTCAYKSLNYKPPEHCPNFSYFFDAFMDAYRGILREDECPQYKPKESDKND